MTGIIALMLQANPQLNVAEVKEILQNTARSDAFTGVTPNTQWGYGKVDAFAAAVSYTHLDVYKRQKCVRSPFRLTKYQEHQL